MASAHTTCHHSIASVAQHPPDLPDEQLEGLVSEIKDYQITHGSLIKLVRHEEPNTVPAVPIGASIFPTPFPRSCFNKAVSLQTIFNKLYASVCQDGQWLHQTLKGVIETDDLVRCLWEIRQAVKAEGCVQDLSLGIFRSDYMLHGASLDAAAIKQVEVNTFSVAGGTHANIVADMHSSLRRKGLYDCMCPTARASCSAAPHNGTIQGIVSALAKGHSDYGRPRGLAIRGLCVLMIVQPFNVNICDERPLEYTLREQFDVPVFRLTFGDDILERTQLTDSSELLFFEHGPPSAADVGHADNLPWEVSLVYHRAGYEPREYHASSGREARLRLERSRAIKCPSVSGHLATLKHVQRALCEPQALARFLPADEARLVKGTFMPMYALDNGSEGRRLAENFLEGKDCERFVLKPCLEGGGHNTFGNDIPGLLRDERDAGRSWERFVLMEMIHPPNINGCLISPMDVFDGPIASELGAFGACMWTEGVHESSADTLGSAISYNEQFGWSLKTKSKSVNEMSVIKGYGCFDTPLLVDT